MTSPPIRIDPAPASVRILERQDLEQRIADLVEFHSKDTRHPLSRHPAWLRIFRDGMGHRVFLLEACRGNKTVGYLPLVLLKSLIFGNRLVSLPYVNSAGIHADDSMVEQLLSSEAIQLADRLAVRSLELRHERRIAHTAFSEPATQKIHMRLAIPRDTQALWKAFDSKVRNQVRKGEKAGLTVSWGTQGQLPAFYHVFSRNMRDLGTPVIGRRLFHSILDTFPRDAEFCVVRQGTLPVAAGLLLHGRGVTEVPSASSLREYNRTCANMLLYWHLLQRAVERGQSEFDFGRSSPESPTYQFKKQWGAVPHAAVWQYYLRRGTASDVRPDNPKYRLMIKVWKRLPTWLTRLIGPPLARVIP